MKLAFIVQRYGREIPGGAETLARQIAERLSRRHQIDVLTTTARDYVTWKNEYPESEEKLRGVRVLRFPVEQERDIEEFNRFSEWIYANPHNREDELRWLEMQGPVTPKLVDYLRNEHQRYDLLVFFTYLYYPTYYGIQVAPEKSVLLPTAHDEPPLKLGIYTEVFENASSFIFNTEAEELLVLERFDVHRKMRETIGIGMELLDAPDTAPFRRRYRVSNRFLLYAGRIDEGKGCGELLSFFRLFREEHPELSNLQLLLIGKKNMSIPNARDIRYLGFLDEDEKLAGMAAANAVVIPSRLESLSIVALEAFSVGTPLVVHGGSRVLVEHCRKANAGLYYTTYEEFEGVVGALLGDKNLARGLGRQGQQYIKENFGWDKLLAHYELAFRSFARERRPRVASERRTRLHSSVREAREPAPEQPAISETADEHRRGGAGKPEGTAPDTGAGAEPSPEAPNTEGAPETQPAARTPEASREDRPGEPDEEEKLPDADPSEERGEAGGQVERESLQGAGRFGMVRSVPDAEEPVDSLAESTTPSQPEPAAEASKPPEIAEDRREGDSEPADERDEADGHVQRSSDRVGGPEANAPDSTHGAEDTEENGEENRSQEGEDQRGN